LILVSLDEQSKDAEVSTRYLVLTSLQLPCFLSLLLTNLKAHNYYHRALHPTFSIAHANVCVFVCL
jgi:hypothetical protein